MTDKLARDEDNAQKWHKLHYETKYSIQKQIFSIRHVTKRLYYLTNHFQKLDIHYPVIPQGTQLNKTAASLETKQEKKKYNES